ncbi:hypothetical protein chiPu_0003452 [Chiloscyllium punctatum]|uniref:C2H2-type domain-containing protein n=1 Tax=Chiloscyllium punctatum TaxID=137246 RepID=A0A401S3R3_CHIPU|nr:hypothetical protein [Chiloscyllium punctatum]
MNIAGIKTQFEDGARNVPCSKYWCDICKVACISALNLQEHIRGYQHRKVEQILKETMGNNASNPTIPAMNMGPDTRTFDDYLLAWNADEPLVGLNYVIEYQRDGGRDPMYECTLCDFTGYLRIFVSHLGGIKHRMNYMSREYPEMVKWDATKLKQEELSLIVKERAAIIEKLEGRRSIKVIRGQDPPSTISVVKRVPLPSNDVRMNQGGSLQEGMNSQSYAQRSYQEYGSKGWQQEWERNPSQVEQDLMEDIVYAREQSLTNKMMYSVPRHDEGQYRTEVRSSDMYSDWRRDDKDFYEESIGVMDRYADLRKDNKSQYQENVSSGYTDLKREREQYVEASTGYEQYSDQRRGPYGDRLHESADWRNVYHKEHESDIRSSDRYSNIRKDYQLRYMDDGRGADWKRDDRKQYEDEYREREQTGKSDHRMQKKGDYSQPPRFPDVIDSKRKKLYNYLELLPEKKKMLNKISVYCSILQDPAMRATLDQRTARSTGTPDDYSRYNPDASASAVRGSESPRGGYDWKQDTLATDVRQSFDSSSYLSSSAARDFAMYPSSGRDYSSDDKSGSQYMNWGTSVNLANTYFGR